MNHKEHRDHEEYTLDLRQKIEEALKQVIDPETSMDVLRMKLINDLVVDDTGQVSLVFTPSSSVCPLAFHLASMIQEAILQINGVTSLRMDVANYIRAEELKKIMNESN